MPFGKCQCAAGWSEATIAGCSFATDVGVLTLCASGLALLDESAAPPRPQGQGPTLEALKAYATATIRLEAIATRNKDKEERSDHQHAASALFIRCPAGYVKF